jgi:hypothetical protein
MFMIGSIKKIFASIFGIFGVILKLPITLISLPLKLLSSKKDKGAAAATEPATKQKKNKAFYLEATDAKGVPAPAAAPKTKKGKKAEPVLAAAAVAAPAALNLPQPTVTVTSTPASTYTTFGPRRRPGANMKSYLDMAKTIKGA